jgi:GntR family transcriptional regulator/MocR family aminotransferase
MARRAKVPLALALEREAPLPLQQQLYDQIRELVLSGRLAPGTRLPASRALATDLGCSRNTVVLAFERLFAEGYLEGRGGSGTFVSATLPEVFLRAAGPLSRDKPGAGDAGPTFSSRGRSITGLMRGERRPRPAFSPGLPDLQSFPADLWGRLVARSARQVALMPEPGGHEPLRRAIADYLRSLRAVRADWRQVLITGGVLEGLRLALDVLLQPGDRVWIEEPGFPPLRGPLTAAGARIAPVPLDDQGLDLEAASRLATDARLTVVAPSRSYPLGTTMSLSRRLALLDWARRRDAWILEDDYDSEYRYAGRPLAALQGLEAAGRVIYLGSFSKVMYPGLRLGYLVVPEHLTESFVRAQASLFGPVSIIAQPALAAFFEEGHFAAHIRRMRALYRARQEALLKAGNEELSGLLVMNRQEAGMHLIARAGPYMLGISDRELARRAAAKGIDAPALSGYFMGAGDDQGLLLGFAALAEEEMKRKARALARALTKGTD